MNEQTNPSPSSSKKGRLAVRIGLCLVLLGAVLLSGQLVEPVLNSRDAEVPDELAWVGAKPAFAAAAADGQKIYMVRCASCHQMQGTGVPGVFPPLTGTEWVTGDPGRLVRVILHGLTGPIEVSGVKYSGAMPPWGTFLTDEEVAAVATYVRANFGNEASEISEAQVTKVRETHKDRKQPWTAAELEQEANQGIPE